MAAHDADLADAIRLIRERALRQVMEMVHRLEMPALSPFAESASAFYLGVNHARRKIYCEIERMIAREEPAPLPAKFREHWE
jgi:hypothetical protein